MAEHLSDLGKRGAALHHRGGEAVTKQVRAVRCGCEARPDEGARHDGRDGRGMREAAVGCASAEENASRPGRWSVRLQVAGERLSHLGEQGEPIAHQALAADDHLSLAPAEVSELERDHLARAQSQSSEEQEDRAVSASRGRRTRAGAQEPFHLACGEMAGHARKSPLAYRRDGEGEVRPIRAAQEQESQERAHGGSHVLRALWCHAPNAGEEEVAHIAGAQAVGACGSSIEALGDQRAHEREVPGDRALRERALPA